VASSIRLSTTFSLYVARRFAVSFAIVLLGIAAMVFILDFIELMRRAASRPEVTIGLLLNMATLKLPFMIEKLIPFAVLFGAMHTYWRLTRFHELVVARSAGVSVWQFLIPSVAVAALVGAFTVTVFNPLASIMLGRYDQLEGRYILGRTNLMAVSSTGLWLRQSDADGQMVLHASRMLQDQMELKEVIVFSFDPANRFIGRMDSNEAKLEDGAWILSNVLLTGPGQPAVTKPEVRLKTDWTPEKIQDSFAAPETLSFWQLPSFITVLTNAGFSATRHRLHWQTLLALPVLLGALVLIGASFSLRPQRQGGVAALVVAGIGFGFLLFFLSDVVQALGMSATIPVVLAAWTPATFAGMIGGAVLLHLEDG
jgi:lipopolysaccharide export system permease protein